MAEPETPSVSPNVPLTGKAKRMANLRPAWKKGEPHPRGGRPKGTDWVSLMIRRGKKHLRELLPLDAEKNPQLKMWDRKICEAAVDAIYKALIVDRDMAAAKILLDRMLGPVPTQLTGANGEPLQTSQQTINVLMADSRGAKLVLELAELEAELYSAEQKQKALPAPPGTIT